MFKKFKPYLCWGSAIRQTAIEKENEKRQENASNLYIVSHQLRIKWTIT